MYSTDDELFLLKIVSDAFEAYGQKMEVCTNGAYELKTVAVMIIDISLAMPASRAR